MSFHSISSKTKYSVTDIKAEEFAFVWTIRNFKLYDVYMIGNSKNIMSPDFSMGKNEEYVWCISIGDNKEYLSLNLVLQKGDAIVPAKLILSICGQQGVEEVFKTTCFTVEAGKIENRYFPEFIKKDYLLDERNGLIINNTLTIKCKLYFECNVINSNVVDQNDLYTDSAISYDLECLFKSMKLSDVKLVVGHKEFQAHKCILASKSRVFLAMFEHDMIEKSENVVKIDDTDPEIMAEVLRFIYCGKIKYEESSLNGILAAANKYELKELKRDCEDKLLHYLNVENIGEMLITADHHEADKLKKNVLNFIKLHAKDINFEKFKIEVESHSPLLVDLVHELKNSM